MPFFTSNPLSEVFPVTVTEKGFSSLSSDELITRGYRDSGANDGNFESFKTNLQTIEQQYLTEAKKNFSRDEDEQKKADLEKKKLETENQELEGKIDSVKKGSIAQLREMIDKLRSEIFDIKADPEKHVTEKPDRSGFYISLAFVILGAVALWAFYASAFYSAVFRQISKVDDTTIMSSLLYGNAISDAFGGGFLSGLFTVIFPAVVLMFGFFIHINMNRPSRLSRYLFLPGSILVTFFLDYLIAYHISKNIHDIIQLNKLEGEMVLYSFGMALTDMNFWMIIFLGFVPTIIWGFVLDHCLKSARNKDVVMLAIRKREEEIKQIEARIAEQTAYIDELKGMISANRQKIAAIDAELEKFSYNGHELRNRLSAYCKGWLQFLSQGDYSNELIQKTSEHSEQAVFNHGGN